MNAYFDNAATTMVCPEAAQAVMRVMTENYGNPSSTHTMGRNARAELEAARKSVAAALGAEPSCLYFTSGGTEADNWAMLGAAECTRHRGKHIITSAVEHDAVLKTAARLQKYGYDVTYLSPEPDGSVSVQSVIDALREDTVLVSIMLVNNETGAVNPLSDISAALKKAGSGALLHTDAVQAFGKIPFTPKALGADLVTISSHKIHGPKGSGALYIKNGLRFPPFITGGGQEKGIRPGTEALPNIAGFGAAAEISGRDLQKNMAKMAGVRDTVVSLLRERLPDAVIISSGGAPHILSISLPGYRSEVLMNFLEARNIFVSKSSACKRGGRSHVLTAMGLPAKIIDGAIRVSFSRYSTREEAEYFVQCLLDAAGSLKKSIR